MRHTTFLFTFLFIFLFPHFGRCDWQSDLEAQFDNVETFDNYEDWIPGVTSAVPQYTTGGLSNHIKSVRYWDSGIPVNDRTKILTAYPGHSVRNSKAIRFNWMGDGAGNQEASSMRYYFGDGTETSGYNDFYIFGMVYIPSDKFPTEMNSGMDPDGKRYGFSVKEGEPSLYMTSAKMIEVSMGFVGELKWSNDEIITSACRWGWSELHFYLAEQKGTSQNWEKRAVLSHTHSGQFSVELSSADVSKWLDRPFYFEIHLRRESAIGTADGFATVTYYNIDGTGEEEVIRAENITLLDSNSSCYRTSGVSTARGNNMKYNWINFESNWRARDPKNGNHDAYLRCGNHLTSSGVVDRPLHCSSYYDDLIINDTRIAPTYFQMLSGKPIVRLNVTNVEPSPGEWVK